MDLSEILSITGKSGLYKLISKTPKSFIVESLQDGHRFPAFSHDGVSALENIFIFTTEDEIALQAVLQAMFKHENGQPVNMPKNDTLLKTYFKEIIPNYDESRVYASNIKKVISWYNILIEHQLIDLEEEKPQEADAAEPQLEPENPQ